MDPAHLTESESTGSLPMPRVNITSGSPSLQGLDVICSFQRHGGAAPVPCLPAFLQQWEPPEGGVVPANLLFFVLLFLC